MNTPSTLSDLVDRAVDRHGASVRQLAAIAQREGMRVTHTTLNQIRSRTYHSVPTDETVRVIAWLAGVSEEEAFTAAGLRVPGPPLSDELPPGVDNLPPRARKVVVDLLRVLVEQEEGEERERRSAATRRARGSRDKKKDADHERRLVREVMRVRISEAGDELRRSVLGSIAEDRLGAELAAYVDQQLKEAFIQVDEMRRPIEMDADYLASLEHQSLTALPRDEADEVAQARRRIAAMSELDVMLAARDDDDDDEAQAQQDEP